MSRLQVTKSSIVHGARRGGGGVNAASRRADRGFLCGRDERRAHGRRSRAQIGGGPVAFNDLNDPAKSQWFNACSAGGTKIYPYGNTFSQSACNASKAVSAVESWTGCDGGYPGIYDMSGNVWEWEDACNGTTGSGDFCRLRGGSMTSVSSQLRCDAAFSDAPRTTTAPEVGFRCCSP